MCRVQPEAASANTDPVFARRVATLCNAVREAERDGFCKRGTVTAALASLRPTTIPKPGRDDKPRTNRRTRLWAGLTSAAVASLALGLGLGLGLRDPPGARLQLVAP